METDLTHIDGQLFLSIVISCVLVSISGVLPAALFYRQNVAPNRIIESTFFRQVQCFSIGTLLADSTCHLLTEISLTNYKICCYSIIVFYSLDKVCAISGEKTFIVYINLAANVLDNFCHGLEIGAAWILGPSFGLLASVCILVHEIPHEISDFCLLLRSGKSLVTCCKLQIYWVVVYNINLRFLVALG